VATSIELDAFTKVKKTIDDMIYMLKQMQDDVKNKKKKQKENVKRSL